MVIVHSFLYVYQRVHVSHPKTNHVFTWCTISDQPHNFPFKMIPPTIKKHHSTVTSRHDQSDQIYPNDYIIYSCQLLSPNESKWYHHNTVDGCEILHQLIDGKHPTIYRVSTILLVVQDFATINRPMASSRRPASVGALCWRPLLAFDFRHPWWHRDFHWKSWPLLAKTTKGPYKFDKPLMSGLCRMMTGENGLPS